MCIVCAATPEVEYDGYNGQNKRRIYTAARAVRGVQEADGRQRPDFPLRISNRARHGHPRRQVGTAISHTVRSVLRGHSHPLLDEFAGELRLEKPDMSALTVADLAIQAVILRTLLKTFPLDGIIAEESAAQMRGNPHLLECVRRLISLHTTDEPLSGFFSDMVQDDPLKIFDVIDQAAKGLGADHDPTRRFWVVDPIDGTEAFQRGEQYAINIALIQDGNQLLSVVACPVLPMSVSFPVKDDDAIDEETDKGCMLLAVRGNGAYIRPIGPGGLRGTSLTELLRRVDGKLTELARSGASPEAVWDYMKNDPRLAGWEMRKYAEMYDQRDERSLPWMRGAHTTTPFAAQIPFTVLRNVTAHGKLKSGGDDIHSEVAANLNMYFPGCNLTSWVLRWVMLALGLADVTCWVYKTRQRHAKIWDHAGAMLLFEEVGGCITDVDGKPIDLRRAPLLSGNFGFVAAPKEVHDTFLTSVGYTLLQKPETAYLSRAPSVRA